MVRRLRRLLVVAVLVALVSLIVTTARRSAAARRPLVAPSPPSWPPLDAPGPAWVLPVDGACPDGYPIKANVRSLIFHVPGGRSYDRIVPHRCYRSSGDAEADGYRAAKVPATTPGNTPANTPAGPDKGIR